MSKNPPDTSNQIAALSEPDPWVLDPQVCREFSISAMTLWRWDHDEELVGMGLPPPVTIRKRKFRSRRGLEGFKKRIFEKAIRERGKPRRRPSEEQTVEPGPRPKK